MVTDRFGRRIDYLRVSVTDRCNLRCRYCRPEAGVPLLPHQEILRYEEIEAVIDAAVELGFRQVRITGGDPLLRRGLIDFLARVSAAHPSLELALTTNGTRLAEMARDLVRAGVRRVNVSLDTRRADRFAALTRGGELAPVIRGIEAALQVGLEPVKINVVLLRGWNEDEVADFARWTLDRPLRLRFIEFMPHGEWNERSFFSAAEAWERITAFSRLVPTPRAGAGPALCYRLPGSLGTIGFISPLTRPFCSWCNRLRLTADGRLLPCLLGKHFSDMKTALRSGAGTDAIRAALAAAIGSKPRAHERCRSVRMVRTGG